MSGSGQDPPHKSRSGREAISDFWEWSGSTYGCPGVVGRVTRMSWSGREALPDVLEW